MTAVLPTNTISLVLEREMDRLGTSPAGEDDAASDDGQQVLEMMRAVSELSDLRDRQAAA